MNGHFSECLLKINIWQPIVNKFSTQQNSVQGLKEVYFDSISDLYLAATWITATDVLVHRVQGQECVCFGGLGKGRMGWLQKVLIKDIWICLASQVDALSCWERRSSWSFRSLQHWERDTPSYHSNSWEAFKRNQLHFAQRTLKKNITKASVQNDLLKYIIHSQKHFNLSNLDDFSLWKSKMALTCTHHRLLV